LNAFAAFTRDHKRYPSSASALFVFLFVRFCSSPSPSSSGMEIYHSLPIFENTSAFHDAALSVISTRSRISINNKINKIFTPKLFPLVFAVWRDYNTSSRRSSNGTKGCRRPIFPSSYSPRELGQHWGTSRSWSNLALSQAEGKGSGLAGWLDHSGGCLQP
jgi:hypothetical protein